MKLRKLTSALIAAGALSSPFAFGLGLGEIKLKSALNQPLEAEIKLLQTRELAKEEILASMAGDAEFQQAGVEKFFFLNDVDFDVALSDSGDGTLILTTKKSIQEPFLNFLVEVNWPNGRALREYTLLLDPPVYEEDLKPVAVTPRASSQPATSQVRQTTQKNSTAQAPVSRSVSSSNGRVANGTFGPVKSTDTMWDIAVAVRPDASTSVQQTMMAIQALNPSAFVAGNINKLKKGAVLRIPSSEEAQRLTHQEAVQQVAAHNDRYRRSLLPDSEQAPQLSAVDQPVVSQSMAPEEARLEIVRPSDSAAVDGQKAGVSGSGQSSGGSIEVIQNELAITQENLDKANRENEKLATRLDALEKQLQAVTKLMTLKDSQMAELQAGVGQGEQAQGEQAQSELESSVVEPMAPASETEAAEKSMMDESTASVDESSNAPVSSVEPDQVVDAANDETAAQAEVAAVEKAASAPIPKPTIVPEAQPQAPVPPASPGIIDQIMNNPVWQAIIGLGALLFVILLFILSRRSYLRESELSEAIDNTTNDGSGASAAMPDQGLDALDKELDSLSIDEPNFGQVSLDEGSNDLLQSDDVLTRADSFIAYGQFDNAVHLVEDAINSEPNRIDLRLKMLEIYAEMQDSQGFEKQKKEIMDLGGDDVADQIRVFEQKLPGGLGSASMDAFDHQSSVDFGEPLMSDEELAAESNDELSYSLEDLESELANDLSGEPLNTAGNSEVDALDFDLDAELGEPSDLEKAQESASEVDDFDFDLSVEGGDALDAETMDISVDLDNESTADASVDLDDIDLSMDDLSADMPDQASTEAAESVDESAIDMEFDLDVDLDASGDESQDLDLVSDIDVSEAIETDIDIELDAVDDFDIATPAVEDNMLGSNESEVDLNSDIEDLSKSLGVDSLDDVDLDAELASASESEAVDHSDDPLLAENDHAEAADGALEESADDALEESADGSVEELVDESGMSLDDAMSDLDSLDLDAPAADELSLEAEQNAVVDEELTLEVDALDAVDTPEVEVAEEVAVDANNAEANASAAELEEDELDFYEASDEVATKLDLARAYVDMGDVDGARDILEEVVLEGNAEQKAEANELLTGL